MESMELPELPEPFQAAHGLRFWPWGRELDGALELRASWYTEPFLRPALFLLQDDGTPFDKVTVNLPEHECGPLEFFVKASTMGAPGSVPVLHHMLRHTTLFQSLGNPRSAGYVSIYAETWTFAKDSGSGLYRVQMPEVRARLAAEVKENEDRRLAIDAANRLRGGKPKRADRGTFDEFD